MDLNKLFKEILERDHNFDNVFEIARKNSDGGGIWLVGGRVYKNLVQELYSGLDTGGILKQKMDYDFIFENPVGFDGVFVPEGWKIEKNSFGQAKLVKGETEIDIIPLKKWSYIIKNKLEPTIENYLEGCFTDVQAIAFDLEREELVGKLGLDAIKNKKIRVINLEELKYCCDIKGVNYKDYLEKLSKSLKLELDFTSHNGK